MGGDGGGVVTPESLDEVGRLDPCDSSADLALDVLLRSSVFICAGGGLAPRASCKGEAGGLSRPPIPARLVALRRPSETGGSSTCCRKGEEILTKLCR